MIIHVKSYTVAVSGATGYAGGEILRLLATHPALNVTTVCGNSSAGSHMVEHQPHLATYADMQIQPTTAHVLANHDVVVLALPHGASGGIAAELTEQSPETVIVDLAADHRLELASAWEKYYGSDHQGTWEYGLPELIRATGLSQRERLSNTRRIAVPGCNVTAVTLGIQPLIAAGLIDVTRLNAVLANGVSGAGRALKPHLLAAEILGGASPYGVGGIHRHIPEIEQNLAYVRGEKPAQTQVRINFTPTLVPMSRGILATVTAPLSSSAENLDDVKAAVAGAYAQAYNTEPFVRVLPVGQWPHTTAVTGSNRADVQWALDERSGMVTVVVAIDNLVRGTAGQALQSTHLALGLDETMALPVEGVAP